VSAHQGAADTYWMVPFQNYKTFCPYLVGSYDRVAEELGRYLATGCCFIIHDVPASADEFSHIGTVIARVGLGDTGMTRLQDWVARQAEGRPDAPAIVFGPERVSYGE